MAITRDLILWGCLGTLLMAVGCNFPSGQPTRFPRDFDLANGLNHRNKIDGVCITDAIQHYCVFYIEFEPHYHESTSKLRHSYLFNYEERFQVEVTPWNNWCNVTILKDGYSFEYFDLTYSEATWNKMRRWRRVQAAAGATLDVRGTRIRIREADFVLQELNQTSPELSKLVFTLSIPLTDEEKKEMAGRPTGMVPIEF